VPISIAVYVSLSPLGSLALRYSVLGPLDLLSIPAALPPSFVDGLWGHTCFEVFVAVEGSPAYREFNFSPSGQWAAYAFRDYRERENFAMQEVAPQIAVTRLDDYLELNVVLAPALLPFVASGKTLQLGLSAVIEATDGSRSYWALTHPAAQPDFHHPAARRLTLAINNSLAQDHS